MQSKYGRERVNRGGCWFLNHVIIRPFVVISPSYRGYSPPTHDSNGQCFRVVLGVSHASKS